MNENEKKKKSNFEVEGVKVKLLQLTESLLFLNRCSHLTVWVLLGKKIQAKRLLNLIYEASKVI